MMKWLLMNSLMRRRTAEGMMPYGSLQKIRTCRIGDSIGDTALHAAVRAAHWDAALTMIEFLEKDHSDLLFEVLNQVNAQGDTVTDLALQNDDVVYRSSSSVWFRVPQRDCGRYVCHLLQEFDTIDIEMRLAVSRLYDAVENDEQDVIQEMLEKELLESQEENGYNAFHVAARSGKLRTLKKMVNFSESSSELNTKLLLLEENKYGNTPLHLAVDQGHVEAARYLVKVVYDAIYKVNKEGYSPLSLAVKRGCVELVRYMIGTPVCESTRKSLLQHAMLVSLAHVAVKTRKLAMLQAVMEGLPDLISSSDRKGWKPLSYAASKGYVDEVSYFLETFQDSARKCDRDGSFPVHKAVAGGNKVVVEKFLLYSPETLYDVDKKGRNVFDIATRYDSKDVLFYLREKTQTF